GQALLPPYGKPGMLGNPTSAALFATNCPCLTVGHCCPAVSAGIGAPVMRSWMNAASNAALVSRSGLGLEGYCWLLFTGKAAGGGLQVKPVTPPAPPPWLVPGWKKRWTFCGTGRSLLQTTQ